jgi:YD repeat-containing protein
MKLKITVVMLALFTVAIVSCQKDVSEDTGGANQGGGQLVRIQQGIDPDIYNDTIRIISYNANKTISKIVDSLNEDSVICAYNASGKLASLITPDDDEVTFFYDGTGLLTQIDHYHAGSNERYLFYYNNGVVEKKEFLSDDGSGGTPVLRRYHTYSVNGGNITSMKTYTSTGTLESETTFTYGSQLNPFKELGLFNNANSMGTLQIINHETYFNKNLMTKSTTNGESITNTYTFNSSQQITKIVSNDEIWDGVYTWLLSYK